MSERTAMRSWSPTARTSLALCVSSAWVRPDAARNSTSTTSVACNSTIAPRSPRRSPDSRNVLREGNCFEQLEHDPLRVRSEKSDCRGPRLDEPNPDKAASSSVGPSQSTLARRKRRNAASCGCFSVTSNRSCRIAARQMLADVLAKHTGYARLRALAPHVQNSPRVRQGPLPSQPPRRVMAPLLPSGSSPRSESLPQPG